MELTPIPVGLLAVMSCIGRPIGLRVL